MAVRPLVTTGVALLSAGAIVAGTPALFVPRDEITVASSAAEAPAHRTLTAEQINLVALSLEGVLEAFNGGYGGHYYQGTVSLPTAGYVLNGNQLEDPKDDTPESTPLYGPDGKRLYLDTEGKTPATVGDMGDNVQFYNASGNKVNENYWDPGNCSASGAMCHDGFTGLAYYLSDNILPLDIVDNIFFEAGFSDGFAYLGSVIGTSIVDAFDPTQRLQLSKRVDEFFAGGAAYLAYSIINDNLPDDAVGEWAKGLNGTFYVDGILGVVDYMVETVKMLIAPDPEEANSTNLLSTHEETEAESESTSGVSSTSLPNVSKLLSLPTNVESPFKKLVEKLEAPADSKLVTTLDLKTDETKVDAIKVDETADDSAEAVVPIAEVAEAETPEVKAPKRPELKLPEIKLPQREIESVDADTNEAAASTESGTETKSRTETKAGTGTSLVRDSLVAKPEPKTTERKKSAGEKFVEKATKNLEKAFKPKTKAGADEKAKAKADSDSGDKDKNDK
ncbi:hypothetical protein [Mycolicibacterium alvei]|uniref:Uncharacterized protein n=1 Tax=Mycolicibacterium alvei TaxID=67081 RepID=A0A6N4UYN8_9MYCO|nr:hypothetical protein [Mycolicibacterium alvei]MCV7000107.1 hypothetical protein [Mycolicibacterium alvei]BBX29508.1 hypothetical protein MALV_46330 [Mycolicibacterium alvei]